MEQDFSPRPYQVELLKEAIAQNTIIFLPTGSGKTFIALQLLKYFSNDLEKSLDDGGKRSVFIVNTVPLVEQQANFIKMQTHVKDVGEYTGARNVDYWTKETWLAEIAKNKVLVMTCQIFVDILRHGYITLDVVNLIIMDECHHAIKEHPMRQLMTLYMDHPNKSQTRILGLTATLLNASCKPCNVKYEVGSLECSLNSKIATVNNMDCVLGYSTNPIERIVYFKKNPVSPILEEIIAEIKICREKVLNFQLSKDTPKHQSMTYIKRSSPSVPKNLANSLQDLIYDIETFGEFGAFQSVKIRSLEIEQLKRTSSNKNDFSLYSLVLSELMIIRKKLMQHLSAYKGIDQLYKLSTPKLLRVLEIIKEYGPGTDKPLPLKGIIFVQRRFTANVLYQIFRALVEIDKSFSFVVPEFVVGMSARAMIQSTESHLERKWIKKALLRFRLSDANLLISSNVIEEGIDIPKCSLVIRFDDIPHYCSYTQSKGRARSKDSDFISMVDEADSGKFESRYKQFKDVEVILSELLVGKTRERSMPTDEQIESELEEQIEPYFTKDKLARASMVSSVSLINRYCSTLPQDAFTNLTVDYFYEDKEEAGRSNFRVMLQFPIMCPIREGIKGDWMPSIKSAKRHAALTACKILHEAGELDDHLMPVVKEKKLEDLALFSQFFDHWLKDEPTTDSAGVKLSKPGSKTRTRQHKRILPDVLTQTMPVPGKDLYLHIMEISTDYPRPSELDNRSLKFYELLNSKQTYAILSSKPLPEICDFPLYLGVGQMHIHLKVNHSFVNLTEEQIMKIRLFHIMLFRDVLNVLKAFLICDQENSGISYLVCPVTEGLNIDWDIVDKFPELKIPDNPTTQQRMDMTINSEDYREAIVLPWYRTISARTVYIVTRVCNELSPESQFPTQVYDSYKSYFHDKYHLQAFHDQPLLEVKALSFNKLNCLKSRASRSKKNFKVDLDSSTFDEHLIPEFCLRIDFPAVLYLKAALLPSILHRTTSLMRTLQLTQLIVSELDIEDKGIQCSPLRCKTEVQQDFSDTDSTQSSTKYKDSSPDTSVDSSDVSFKDDNAVCQNEINNYEFELQKLNREFPWDISKEPIDYHREIDNIMTIDLEYYCKFINRSEYDFALPIVNHQLAICCPPKLSNEIKLLNQMPHYIQLCDMLSVVTAKTANDICDLERLETLGDSFLKFSVTLYLLNKFRSYNEGHLTFLKGQIIGNKNLLYCGLQKNLAGYMNIYDFAPCADWIPPGFILSKSIKDKLIEKDISAEVLYGQVVPDEEVLAGAMSQQTLESILNDLDEICEDRSESTTLENFIGMLKVSDKTVADAIEALIGQFLCSHGIKVCMKLLAWLKVIPKDDVFNNVFDLPPMPAKLDPGIQLSKIDFFLPGRKSLEETLGYRFIDRSYLLQALSHASYTMNRFTDCYQRLEFLGDAILDFLITCYIYENCGLLSPGELTDLRSALVNNVTFASLTVRYGFHGHLLSLSPSLSDSVTRFVKYQEARNHIIDDELLFLLQEGECTIAEYVDVPKVLGDLFESLAGAVYLDSGMNLNVVWDVFYKLMSREIIKFSEKVPKQVVRLLYESNCKPRFEEVQKVEDLASVVVPLKFTHEGKESTVFGLGLNKQQAKKAAAKMAIQMIHS